METFDFQEALSYIEAGMKVKLTLNGSERCYFLNEQGDIVCTPNNKEHLTYKVKQFYIDSIVSNNWELVDDTTA